MSTGINLTAASAKRVDTAGSGQLGHYEGKFLGGCPIPEGAGYDVYGRKSVMTALPNFGEACGNLKNTPSHVDFMKSEMDVQRPALKDMGYSLNMLRPS